MPPARRQTRQEHEAFMARLEGRDSVARYRQQMIGSEEEKTPQKPPLTVKGQKKPVVRKQKMMTKKEEADIVRRDKAAKKARAVQHVEATTALRTAANEKERDRILQEEKDGPVSFYWRTSRISPVGTFSIVPVGAFDIAPAGDFCIAPVGDIASACPPVERALEPAGTVVPTAVSARDDDALNSDIDGDDGYLDGWYSESEPAEEGIDRVGSCDVDVSSTCETGDAAHEAVNSSDDGID
ncbi:Hypothetical protein PHPALM_9384, partial [Phytophthora palmivora]